MRRRVLYVLPALLLSLLSLLVQSAPLSAQVSFVPTATTGAPVAPVAIDQEEIVGLLQRGQTLEQERRWGEALTLFEDALKSYPSDNRLEQHFNLARIHYDLGRRYNDSTFRDSVAKMQPAEALDLYAEVMLKVQSHYVDVPEWQRLVDHGSLDLEAALNDPLFVERHLPSVPVAQIDRFRRDLRPQLAAYFGNQHITSRSQARDAVAQAAKLAREQLGLAETATALEYVCGATNLLDPYSTFLTTGQLNEVYSQIEGNFVGLGIELKSSEGSLLIVKVITGSPAERGGLRGGDRIISVDGRDTKALSTDQAANLLQGAEGSIASVTVVSPGRQPRQLRIRREQVEVPSVDDVKMVDRAAGIGYFKLTCFQKTTARDLDAALWKLHRDGMKSLVIDLRGNPGGLLTTSVDVVDRFVDQGTIVSTKGRNTHEDYTYSAHTAGTWHMPLVVLIDGDSASASEIFAGAIRDHRRGTIVGTRSYGKGSVQGIFPLNVANSGLRLTTAKFYSPNGLPFSRVGVEPDVLVQQTARPDEAGNVAAAPTDAMLDAAVNVARKQMARR